MGKKLRIKVKRPWISYPGSLLQNTYAETLKHGYLLWDIKEKGEWNVEYCELPNPKPFVTVQWMGNVEDTVAQVTKNGSRVRVKSDSILSHSDVLEIQAQLKGLTSDLTFKSDNSVDTSTVSIGKETIQKSDLRNVSVITKMVADYYKNVDMPEDEWNAVRDLIRGYMHQVMGDDTATLRNVKWRPKYLSFNNMFSYGEKNVVNFDALSGLVGIFGPNSTGKSSLLGTIIYSMFNSADRDGLVNMYIPNERKMHSDTQMIVEANAADYVIERKIEKYEKKGKTFANASLIFTKVNAQDAEDLREDQSRDTEKVIRKNFGTADDFMMTSVCAQDDVARFIKQGSTNRLKIASRFLELDVINKVHDLCRADLNNAKNVVKSLRDCDWDTEIATLEDSLANAKESIDGKTSELTTLSARIVELRTELSLMGDATVVTQEQISKKQTEIKKIEAAIAEAQEDVRNLCKNVQQRESKLVKVDSALSLNDVKKLRDRLNELQELRTNKRLALQSLDENKATLGRYNRSLSVLQNVPCNGEGEYATCMFIKDAKLDVDNLKKQAETVDELAETLQHLAKQVNEISSEGIEESIDKVEKLQQLRADIVSKIANDRVKVTKLEANITRQSEELANKKAAFVELERAFSNEDNAKRVELKNEIDKLTNSYDSITLQKSQLSRDQGRYEISLEQAIKDRDKRAAELKRIRAYELVVQAFSKKAIPLTILKTQLPIINNEVAEILRGIVNFTVELEIEDDKDALEVYINYGDAKRVIELAGGMERTLAALAIRVAMINVSTLPKSDILMLDECFSAMDDVHIEACTRFLASLKRYFRVILISTHIDAIKDSVDVSIEITKLNGYSKISIE